jgi:hypothetical protein
VGVDPEFDALQEGLDSEGVDVILAESFAVFRVARQPQFI